MEWRTLINYPNYSVSSTGLIWNNKFDRPVAFSTSYRGLTAYQRVTLFTQRKRSYKQVHRLVAEAFLANPLKLPQVDHIDGNGLNNSVANLQWITASENVQKAFIQHPKIKKQICSSGGIAGAITMRKKATEKYRTMLDTRFVQFHPSGEIDINACVSYHCACGVPRTASIMWKELRVHKGKCPSCTGTVNRSNPSLR